MINDELKRRMTSSQGGLTPRMQRKGELCCVVIRAIVQLNMRVCCIIGSFISLRIRQTLITFRCYLIQDSYGPRLSFFLSN